MRIVLAAILAAGMTGVSASAAAAAAPALRVVPGPALAVQGTGFVPRALVQLRLAQAGDVVRAVWVRAGSRGGFLVRFPALERCSVSQITASGPRARQARVPTTWFIRECPPPPPLGLAP